MAIFCLEMHARWQCRHSGACCRAGWAIPVEGPAFERLSAHFGARARPPLFVTGGPLPEGAAAMLATKGDGGCVFHTGSSCGIHHELGPSALPSACRQFPRMVLRDGRGTFVTLSHFCPTAAAMLMEPAGAGIIEAPPPLSLGGGLEGLEAADVLPPLLRTGLLTDLDGYGAWEQRSIQALAFFGSNADEALALVDAATKMLEGWAPDDTSLRHAVRSVFLEAPVADAIPTPDGDARRFAHATSAVPPGLPAPGLPDPLDEAWRDAQQWWLQFDRSMRAFLIAHLFGNWVAYFGSGLGSVVEYLRICASVLRVEAARQLQAHGPLSAERRLLQAIRQADLLLIHLVDIRLLADRIDVNPQLPAPRSQIRQLGVRKDWELRDG